MAPYELDAISIVTTERCNARCCACGYWRRGAPQDFDPAHLTRLLPAAVANGVQRVVWTGGEPTLHRELPEMMAQVRESGLANTLITNGILLHSNLELYGPLLSTLILSLDAPFRELYGSIRGVDAFDRLVSLPGRVRCSYPGIGLVICLVVQRRNIDVLEEFLALAAELRVDRVAFLAPDLYGFDDPELRGGSFGRDGCGEAISVTEILPTEFQIDNLMRKIPDLRRRFGRHPSLDCPTLEFLEIYGDYFRSYHRGLKPANNPLCSMPRQHTVVTVDGRVKPCFFVPEAVSPRADCDPLRNQELDELRDALLTDSAVRERSCRICMQTVRKYR